MTTIKILKGFALCRCDYQSTLLSWIKELEADPTRYNYYYEDAILLQ